VADTYAGRVVGRNGKDIEIRLPPGQTAEVGERFGVLDDSGKQIAIVKVIKSDPNQIIARQFQQFVSDEVLGRAVGAGVGAAVGSIFSLDPPGASVGAMIGAAVGSALSQRPGPSIRTGMKVEPVAELARALESSKADEL